MAKFRQSTDIAFRLANNVDSKRKPGKGGLGGNIRPSAEEPLALFLKLLRGELENFPVLPRTVSSCADR